MKTYYIFLYDCSGEYEFYDEVNGDEELYEVLEYWGSNPDVMITGITA